MIDFINANLNYYLLVSIILGGIFIKKYAKIAIENTYKVLILSLLLSVAFFYFEKCDFICVPKYLFTYLFATSFYEVIVRKVLEVFGSVFTNKDINALGGTNTPANRDEK